MSDTLGLQIRREAGNSLQEWVNDSSFSQARHLGLTFRCVTFADHRSGWNALRVTVGLIFWQFAFYPVRWRTEKKESIGPTGTCAIQIALVSASYLPMLTTVHLLLVEE